MIMILAKIVQP